MAGEPNVIQEFSPKLRLIVRTAAVFCNMNKNDRSGELCDKIDKIRRESEPYMAQEIITTAVVLLEVALTLIMQKENPNA